MAATRNPKLRLLHIRDEIDGLTAALAGVSFEQYRGSYALRRVTERALQIVSEAARAYFLQSCSPDIPTRRGARLSALAMSCGMNISILTIAASGTSQPFTCRNFAQSCWRCLPTPEPDPI